MFGLPASLVFSLQSNNFFAALGADSDDDDDVPVNKKGVSIDLKSGGGGKHTSSKSGGDNSNRL